MAARMPCTAATQETREKTNEPSEFAVTTVKEEHTDDLCAEGLSLLAGEGGSQATRDDVDEDGLGSESRDSGGQELSGLDTLDEANIGTSVSSKLETGDGLVHAKHLGRVGTTDDNLQHYG